MLRRLALAVLFAVLLWRWLLRKLLARPRRVVWEAPFEPLDDPYLADLWRRDAA